MSPGLGGKIDNILGSPASASLKKDWPSIDITLENKGNDATTVSSIDIDNIEFSHDLNTPFEVPPFGIVTLTAQFAPLDEGPETAVMTIESDTEYNPSLSLNLTGTGVIPPCIEINPNSLSEEL